MPRRWIRQASTCSIDGCEKQTQSRGWCSQHYARWRKHGDPLYVRPDSQCEMDDCESRVHARGLCQRHYYLLRSNGDPSINRSPRGLTDITYATAHRRAAAHFGSVGSHVCVDCGNAAAEWSYKGSSDTELVDPKGRRYSPNPEDYEPRCVPCHKIFDSLPR